MSHTAYHDSVLAGLCLGLNGHPKSDYGDNIKAVTLLSPTIFPIVYAAILGKLLHRIGLYKAERGVTMGVSPSASSI
jgi:hypothetical protein